MDAIATFGIRVDGLSKLERLPGGLERAQRVFLGRSASKLAANVARRAPGGSGGSIGRAVTGRAITSQQAVIEVRHPGARAQEYGAYITPRGLRNLSHRELVRQPRRLRFQVGGRTVFAPAVRLKPTGFFRRGLRDRTRVLRAEFQRAFDRLG